MQTQTISLRKLCRIASKRDPNSITDTTTLCMRCGAIRLRLEPILPACDDLVFLGSLRSLEERQGCAFCRFLLRSLPVHLKSTTDKGDIQCRLTARLAQGEAFVLECRHGLSTSTIAWIRIDCPPGILQGIASVPYPDRRLNSNELDAKVGRSLLIEPQKIRAWLDECETWHQGECAAYQFPSHRKKTKHLLLIDVVDNRLVYGDQDSRYVALSYVTGGFGGSPVLPSQWLGVQDGNIQKKGALHRLDVRLPETLRDAMELTRSSASAICGAMQCAFLRMAGPECNKYDRWTVSCAFP